MSFEQPTIGIVMDLDGTLTPSKFADWIFGIRHECSSHWMYLDRRILPRSSYKRMKDIRNKNVDRIHDSPNTGENTDQIEADWLVESIEVYLDAKISLEALNEIFSIYPIRDGVVEMMKQFSEMGFKLAINTYGLYEVAKAIARAHGIEDYLSAILGSKLLFDANGIAIGSEPDSFVLGNNKGKFTKAFMEAKSVDLIIGIGDKPADKSIVYHNNKRLGVMVGIGDDKTNLKKLTQAQFDFTFQTNEHNGVESLKECIVRQVLPMAYYWYQKQQELSN